MFASTLVMMTETTLLTMEASRVIALRMQVFMLGGPGALQEADLMIDEKARAFKKALIDLSNGVPQSNVRSDIRSVVQANIRRLAAPTA